MILGYHPGKLCVAFVVFSMTSIALTGTIDITRQRYTLLVVSHLTRRLLIKVRPAALVMDSHLIIPQGEGLHITVPFRITQKETGTGGMMGMQLIQARPIRGEAQVIIAQGTSRRPGVFKVPQILVRDGIAGKVSFGIRRERRT